MPIATTELKTELVELSSESFDAFCEDISSMFGIETESSQTDQPSEEKLIDLKKRFKKISAFNTVNAEGKLDGKFYLVFDHAGTFILSGTIVMMPEKRILEEIKKGLIQDIESMTDAIKEIGNLAVGAWDRIFRKNFQDHGHFVQDNVYIGKPWNDTKDAIDLESDEEIMFIPYEIAISPFPAFKCGVIFPKSLFEEKTPVETKAEADENDEGNQQQDTEETKEQITEENSDKESEKTETAAEAQDGDLTQQDQNNAEPAQSDDAIQQQEQPEQQQEPKAQPEPEQKQEPETTKQKEPSQVSESVKEITQSTASLPGEKNSFALNIKAKDIMNKDIVWCSSEDCVQQALTNMQQYNTMYLMIGEDNQGVEGIISRADLDAAMSPYLRPIFSKWRRDLDDATLKIKLKWLMCKTVCFIKPQTPMIAIIQKMKKSAKLCLPVMEDNKVLGLITVSDIFSVILDSCPDEYKKLCDEI
ncbi:MAG: CBS domain-containing protein [Planctomycetes bacterium]|nr:CBS domain-containing protein [Planctomycetota bacterium]